MIVLSGEKPGSSANSLALSLWWEGLRVGDHASFEKVYHLAFSKLYQYGCKITSEDVVEEVVQELFIHIWNNRESLPQVSHPTAYLFRAFRNSLSNHISRKKKHQTISLNQLPDFSYQLNDETQGMQRIETLQKAINKLSHQQREVMYLLYFNDLSATEVADVLSLKVRTVYNTAHNALAMLRHYLQKEVLIGYFIPATCLLYLLQVS